MGSEIKTCAKYGCFKPRSKIIPDSGIGEHFTIPDHTIRHSISEFLKTVEWGEEVPNEQRLDKDKIFYKSCDLNSMFKKLWTEASSFCSQLSIQKDLRIAYNRAFVLPNLDNFPYGFFS